MARIERGQMEPVIEMGDLSVRRDYTDVRDVVRAYELALQHCVLIRGLAAGQARDAGDPAQRERLAAE